METKISLREFDKKIIIKEKVEKGKKKTIISKIESIDGYENNKKSYEEFGKQLKTKLGCGCSVLTEENTIELVFQGYHKEKIINYMKEKYPKLKIST